MRREAESRFCASYKWPCPDLPEAENGTGEFRTGVSGQQISGRFSGLQVKAGPQ